MQSLSGFEPYFRWVPLIRIWGDAFSRTLHQARKRESYSCFASQNLNDTKQKVTRPR